MNKQELQHAINAATVDDDHRAHVWLKSEGLDSETFAYLELSLAQAQRIAHNSLKHHGHFLGSNEAALLNTFLKALTNQARRRRITQAQIHKVMNIGSQVNRKAFKQLRQLEKQAKTKAR